MTNPQFATGPQKWVVRGPVGLETHALRRTAKLPPCFAALIAMILIDLLVSALLQVRGRFLAGNLVVGLLILTETNPAAGSLAGSN